MNTLWVLMNGKKTVAGLIALAVGMLLPLIQAGLTKIGVAPDDAFMGKVAEALTKLGEFGVAFGLAHKGAKIEAKLGERAWLALILIPLALGAGGCATYKGHTIVMVTGIGSIDKSVEAKAILPLTDFVRQKDVQLDVAKMFLEGPTSGTVAIHFQESNSLNVDQTTGQAPVAQEVIRLFGMALGIIAGSQAGGAAAIPGGIAGDKIGDLIGKFLAPAAPVPAAKHDGSHQIIIDDRHHQSGGHPDPHSDGQGVHGHAGHHGNRHTSRHVHDSIGTIPQPGGHDHP